MVVVIGRVGQQGQLAGEPAWNVAEHFCTRAGIEGVQHAIVGPHEHHRRACRMVGDKGLVTRSGVARGRLATVDDTRIHDIAEQLAAAVAKQDTIVGPVSPQVIEAELAVAIRRGTGARLVQGSLLGTGKAVPCEIVGPCRRGIAADHDVARRSRGRKVAELLAGTPGAAAGYRGGAGAVERHGKGLQVAGPAGSIEGRLIDQRARRRTDDARL